MFIDNAVIKKIKSLIHCLAPKPVVSLAASFLFIKTPSEGEHIWGTHWMWCVAGYHFFLHHLHTDQDSHKGSRSTRSFLQRTTPLGSQRNNGSFGVSQVGTEWHRGDSDPVRGSLGPPEMVFHISILKTGEAGHQTPQALSFCWKLDVFPPGFLGEPIGTHGEIRTSVWVRGKFRFSYTCFDFLCWTNVEVVTILGLSCTFECYFWRCHKK